MSKTYRLNPETFEEAQERNHLKRKKKEAEIAMALKKAKQMRELDKYSVYCGTEDNEHDN